MLNKYLWSNYLAALQVYSSLAQFSQFMGWILCQDYASSVSYDNNERTCLRYTGQLHPPLWARKTLVIALCACRSHEILRVVQVPPVYLIMKSEWWCPSLILKVVSEFPFYQNWIDSTSSALFSLSKVGFPEEIVWRKFAPHFENTWRKLQNCKV